MHFLQAINSDISVLRVCNKTGGTIKGDIKKKKFELSVNAPVGRAVVYRHKKQRVHARVSMSISIQI